MVVLSSHARQRDGLYSAVETGITFLSLSSLDFRILAAVPGIAGDLFRAAEVGKMKRVVDHQIKRRPFTDFAISGVLILSNVVNDGTGIESAEIVEQARIPVVSRIRAKSRS